MTLKEGKFYITRDGRTVGPVVRIYDTCWDFWIPSMNCKPYQKNGNGSISGWITGPHDLIKEL